MAKEWVGDEKSEKPDAPSHLNRSQLRRAALLAFGLLGCGFIAGYGYGFGIYRATIKNAPKAPLPSPIAPVVKGMKLSPDGRLLAFTGVYDQSRRAATFVLDLRATPQKITRWTARETPSGWQDFVTQWSRDGRDLLIEREKIPRPVAEAKAGFYRRRVSLGGARPIIESEGKSLSEDVAPEGEKIIGGLWDARGQLIIRTRREPKALFQIEGEDANLIDRTTGSFLQSRAVIENGRQVFYTVRPRTSPDASMALFRIQNGRARQLGAPLGEVAWVYLSDDARRMIAARTAPNGIDWRWSFHSISPRGVSKQRESTIPGDVISVYWSPDYRTILGASGQSLWLIDIATGRARRLTARHDWDADDASWTANSKAVLIAANGKIHRIDIASGATRVLWTFPTRFWL